MHQVARAIAVAWALFQVFTAIFGSYHAMIQRPIHVSFALALCFALSSSKRARETGKTDWRYWVDALLVIGSLSIGTYFIAEADRITTRIGFMHPLTAGDYFFGFLIIALLLEAARRVAGWAVTFVASAFLLYGVVGPHLPGLLAHRGLGARDLIEILIYTSNGVFGIPTGVSTDYVFYFILFAAFLEASGAGQLFLDLALRWTRSFRGGSAKGAIIASSLMGTISGSAVGNVAATGVFTIPLMKRSGISPVMAGAVEAAASTGGQIMPPIMGAAAFIMAEMIGVPYSKIIEIAVVPAIAYYLSLLFMVDLLAVKEQWKPVDPKENSENGKSISGKVHLLIPLVILVYYVLSGFTLMTSAMYATGTVIAVSLLRRATWVPPIKWLQALEDGARQAVPVAVPSAAAGIIVGVVITSGLGLKLSEILIAWSGEILLLALFLTMVACIILGMGMPTSTAYIIAAILLAPALVRLGVPPMAAHFFILYFGSMSMVTPPVALASYAAAGISGASLSATGWTAFGLASAGFLVPYAVALQPVLVHEGTWTEWIWAVSTLMIGVYMLAVAAVGHVRTPLKPGARLLAFLAALGLVVTSHWLVSLVALAISLVILTAQWWPHALPAPIRRQVSRA